MKNLLTQNTKMKKSSQNGITVVNWTIPAFISRSGLKTCPMAGVCAAGCYARSGTYQFGNVKTAHETKFELTQKPEFESKMIAEIESWLNKKSVKSLKVRIHDSGDFYSEEYLNKWIKIMNHFETNTKVSFYAYTKMVQLFKVYQSENKLPASFRILFSYGGKQDHLIIPSQDFNSRVFESLEDLKNAGYVDGTEDDMIAAEGTSKNVGLVYHGTKLFKNTTWSQLEKKAA